MFDRDTQKELASHVFREPENPEHSHRLADWYESVGKPAHAELIRLRFSPEATPDWHDAPVYRASLDSPEPGYSMRFIPPVAPTHMRLYHRINTTPDQEILTNDHARHRIVTWSVQLPIEQGHPLWEALKGEM